MGGKIGIESKEKGYRSVIGACGHALEPVGRLEMLMDACSASKSSMILHEQGYVAFRRRGKVYALKDEDVPSEIPGGIKAGLDGMKTSEERVLADIVAKMVESGEISCSAFRQNSHSDLFCIASFPYNSQMDSGKQYTVPESARWVRLRNKKIVFYGANIPVHREGVEDRRRKYFAVPEGAAGVKRLASSFEWLMPGDSGSYEWRKI